MPLKLLLLQDEVVGYFFRFAQAMLKKICKGSVSPDINGSAVDSPEHDSLSWMTPPGQLEGPNCTRPLRSVVKKPVDECAGHIDYVASGWTSSLRVVKIALRKGLRTHCSRRRTSARLRAYRTRGVYMDNDVKEASMDRVVIATEAQNASEAAKLATLATPGNVSYRFKLKDGAREIERPLDLNETATSIIAELLFLDATEVWTSVRAGGAACLLKYADAVDFPKKLRPESAEARKSVVRCMRNELKDLEAGDIDKSDEEAN